MLWKEDGQTDRRGQTGRKGETQESSEGDKEEKALEGQSGRDGGVEGTGEESGESEEQSGEWVNVGTVELRGGSQSPDLKDKAGARLRGMRALSRPEGVRDHVPAPLPTSPANPPAARKSVFPSLPASALLPSLPRGRQARLPSQIQSLHLRFSELGMKEGEANAALKPADGQIFIIFAQMDPRKPARDSSKSI